MVGFHLKDGRAIALQRDVSGMQLWLEDDDTRGMPPVLTVRHYLEGQPRHSNLPSRLKHSPPSDAVPRPVMTVSVRSVEELRELLDWYDGGLSPLLALKQRFLSAFPDFEIVGAFAATAGSYHDTYRKRVDALLAATAQHPEDGSAVLQDVLAASQGGRGALPPFFDGDVNWRVPRAREVDPASFNTALDTLIAMQDDPAEAAVTFNQTFRPALEAIGEPNTFRDTRVVPSTVLAAIAPDRAISVRYQLYVNAERLLNDRALFANKPMSADEYRAVLALAEQIRAAMIEWGWAPRDLWDVHGFILATCGKQKEAEMDDAALLARFRRSASFCAVQERWSPEQNAAFCTIARTVHAAGLDWYFVNLADRPVRFGRKSPRSKNAQAVLGVVEGTGTPRMWFRKNDAALELGVDDIFLNKPDAERFGDLFEQHGAAIEAWFPPDPPRPGRWPDEYGENMVEDQDVAVNAGSSIAAPTNLILYGPPGTGKTYATAAHSVRLCGEAVPDDRAELMAAYKRLTDAGRIEFVTFHQSMAYEEFVEGLRPEVGGVAADDGMAESGTGGFRLRPKDGIFKQISERARLTGLGRKARLDRRRGVFKIALGRPGKEEDRIAEGLERGLIHLGWGGEIDWADESFDSFQAIKRHWQETVDPHATGKDPNIEMMYTFRGAMEPGDYVILSEGRDLVRGIAEITGDYRYDADAPYHPHRRAVRWLWQDASGILRDRFYPRQFRRHSTYQLDGDVVDWDALDAIVFGAAASTIADDAPFVLVIDEINRANISKVFGELITLLEADKRIGAVNELRVRLPYSGDSFGVPANLHIVGTMNTADRSIALLDTALRRRFTFEELMPDASVLGPVDGIDLPALLRTLNDRIEYLFDREHQIGHAYFLPCRTRDDVGDVMRHKVIPLLAEYFYEDWTKVAAVLGDVFPDDGKYHEGGFLSRRALPSPFGAGEGEEAYRYRWAVRDPADFSYAKAVAVA
ncbi:AAA family ATPase [Sphingomonas sp.]|uniref:AAA family ATPase n=1 Tax=Sphingomonas sp. TaxID=28214 RepID=UPI0035C7C288